MAESRITKAARLLEQTTPDTHQGHALVGWALYNDHECQDQEPYLALNSWAAAKWLLAKAGRAIVPVYSDTWFYGAEEE